MVNFQRKQRYGWEDLLTIMHLLRAPEGCPWDREQTHQSIRRNFLEEAYEVAEAIDEGSTEHLKEELGDVLLQVVFHSSIEQDADSVMFIYRDDYYNPNTEEKNIAEIIIAKNRHGETGTVKTQWMPQYTTFSDLEWKHEG